MIATYEAIVDAALELNPADRCRIASSLWESVREPVSELEGDALEALLDQREAEMDQTPSQVVSHEEFLSHFSSASAPRLFQATTDTFC